MDVCARALLIAEAMIQDGGMTKFIADRYQSWKTPLARAALTGKLSLEDLSNHVLQGNVDPAPVSGRQEYLENWLNRFI
jgi:xylose isomerase